MVKTLLKEYSEIAGKGRDLNTDGCIQLVGAVINLAISNAQCKNKNKYSRLQTKDANDFLFEGNRLYNFLATYHLENTVSVTHIRNMARKEIEGDVENRLLVFANVSDNDEE